MIIKNNYILSTLLFLSIFSFGQENIINSNSSNNIDLFPKTPEAYAFSKFVDIPAGNHTGVANFSIPIFNLQLDEVAIPISLDYSTSGVKVDEIASRVGIGWYMNAGPSLSMQVIGGRDLDKRPILDITTFQPNEINHENEPSYQFAKELTAYRDNSPALDIKPDIYTFRIPSASGKFIVDSRGEKGIPIPYNDIIITKNLGGVIEIKDIQGSLYTFLSLGRVVNYNTCQSGVSDMVTSDYVITSILTNKGKLIKYEYDYSAISSFITNLSEQYVVDTKDAISFGGLTDVNKRPKLADFCLQYNNSNLPVLKRIIYEEGEISFNYNANSVRQDLPGEVYLKNIQIKNKKGILIKDYQINTDYFVSNKMDLNTKVSTIINRIKPELVNGIDKRLKLTSVEETLTNSKYQFEYYENKSISSRLSFNQDYWGVYNGANNISTSIARVNIKSIEGNKPSMILPDKLGLTPANKKPNLEYGIIGNLKKITYPTGGSMEVEYEADEYVMGQSSEELYSFYNEASTTLQTNYYTEFNVNNVNIYDFRVHFTGDNDHGSGIEQMGNCKLNIIDQTTGKNILVNPFQYTTAFDGIPINESIVRGKSFKMRIEPGWDQIEAKVINCYAHVEWTEGDEVLVPEHLERVGTIRVKRIVLKDKNEHEIIKSYKYLNPITNKSSGQLYAENQFRSFYTKFYVLGNSVVHGVQIILTNNPGWQINTVNGKSVGYEYVNELFESNNSDLVNYNKISKFNNEGCHTEFDNYSFQNFVWPICSNSFGQGQLLEDLFFDDNRKLIKKINHHFVEDKYFNRFSSSFNGYGNAIGYGIDIGVIGDDTYKSFAKFIYTFFPFDNSWMKKTGSTITEYFDNNKEVVTEIENIYSPTYIHLQPIATKTTNSKGETTTTEYQYPPDRVGDPIAEALTAQNRIAEPLVIRQKVGDMDVSETYTQYQWFNNNTLLQKSAVFQKKGKEVQEKDRKITYNSYDQRGNLTQYTPEGGLPVSIIWGYNGQYPVAKIEGVIRSAINGPILTNLENSTSLTTSSFDDLRSSIPQAMITSYTYQPLVGVTSITGPNKQTEYYHYDPSGRLASITNSKAEVLKTFNYHYSTN